MRTTDVLNLSMGTIILAFAGWAGTKLTALGEDVATVKTEIRHISKVINKYDDLENRVDGIDKRLTRVESKLEK